MATIKDIAALAGVSRGTVDRVLNNRGSVNPATAEKINEIAKALDYKPNKAGLALAAQKKKLKLGVILFSTDNPFFADVLQGVHKKAEDLAGYNCSVLVKQIPINVDAQLSAIDELLREEVNGIAIAPQNDGRIRTRINELSKQGIPVVTFNTDIENSARIAYVGSNYTKSGRTAAGLLRLMTHGDVLIGIITGSSEILCHTERIAGFTDALKPCQKHMQIVSIAETQDDEIESYEQTLRLLKEHPKTNALFFAAGGVYGGCRAGTCRKTVRDCLRQSRHNRTVSSGWRAVCRHLPAAAHPRPETARPALSLPYLRRTPRQRVPLYGGGYSYIREYLRPV